MKIYNCKMKVLVCTKTEQKEQTKHEGIKGEKNLEEGKEARYLGSM